LNFSSIRQQKKSVFSTLLPIREGPEELLAAAAVVAADSEITQPTQKAGQSQAVHNEK